MTLTRLHEQPPYEPPGHDGVVNRLLAGAELGTSEVSIWHGRFEPGGESDEHVHAHSAQVYIGLTGRFVVTVGGDTYELAPMWAVTIPAGVPHDVRNATDGEAMLLVVSAPALR